MLKNIIKNNGVVEEFSAEKLNKWAQYATKTGGNWSEIAMETYKRLPETAKSSDIHQMMINVCLDKEDINYSRIAARLEQASLRKNMERVLGVSDRDSFKEIFEAMIRGGVWDEKTMPEYNPVWESWYEEIYPTKLEYWQIVQWGDKYAVKKKGLPVETPHIGAMGIGLGLHGDSEHAYNLIKAVIQGKVNLPTPALNGIRTGDFDTISCCIITGGDSVDSIGVAEHIAYKMTAKKAGIGIEFDTRSKGAPVKGGAVDHLGKHSIYSCLDKAVKMFTQMCYDGETEVLTARGWKYFKDLVPEDLIAQVNDDRTLEFVPHTTFVSYEINQDKKMVKFSNKYVNAFVTDNHKMVYRTKKYESPVTSAGSYSECRADEFRASRCNVLDFGGHKVGSIDKLSAQDKFRIALQADGTVRVNKTCENTYVFTFNKQRKISEFRDLLGQLGLEEKCEKSQDRGYSVNLRKNGNGVGTIFTVSKVGFDCDKSLSWVYDRDFSCEWGKEFLEYVSKWDATTTGTHFEYYTKDMQNVDVVQFVAACCGLYSKVDDIKSRSCYTVRVSQFESVTSEGVKKEIVEDYIGKVYCVEVPSHRLVVRREGRTLVCGNTRGGNATVTFKCIDPEVESILMWKTQRVDIETRLDKTDYSFAYNDAFLQAVIKDEDWYLFDLIESPILHEKFYVAKADEYNEIVKKEVESGKKYKKLKAREILRNMLIARNETGRMYSINVTRVNEHTPFIDVVRLSNL